MHENLSRPSCSFVGFVIQTLSAHNSLRNALSSTYDNNVPNPTRV